MTMKNTTMTPETFIRQNAIFPEFSWLFSIPDEDPEGDIVYRANYKGYNEIFFTEDRAREFITCIDAGEKNPDDYITKERYMAE